MKATVLADNNGSGKLCGEWGLSIYIEYGTKRILLDAGASGLFAENAAKLGLPLEQVDYGVLSHAHFDHANGIGEFFRINSNAPFYLQRSCAPDCYGKKWIFSKYIGIPRNLLSEYGQRLISVDGDLQPGEGVYLIAHHTDGLEQVGRRELMYRRQNGKWRPDDFSHEQSLVIDTPKGLVIFNSCSHGGAVNIIREVSSALPKRPVHALIGGLHLFNKSEDEVRALGRLIRDTGIECVYTGHCTGDKAYRILADELGTRLHAMQVGTVMEF